MEARERLVSSKTYAGYFVKDNQELQVVEVLERRKDELKIQFEYVCLGIGVYNKILWIPKKDFHPYYTTEELSRIINQMKK